MPQKEQRKNQRARARLPVVRATAGNRLCEKLRWCLQMSYAQPSEVNKKKYSVIPLLSGCRFGHHWNPGTSSPIPKHPKH